MTQAVQALSAARPFPGLRPFDFADHEFFFGRSDQIASLYRLVDRNKFVAVIGNSGSGKSSLTRAGLLHLLDKENAEGRPGQWVWKIMRPGAAPVSALAEALSSLVDDPDEITARTKRERIEFQLNRSSFGLAEAVGEAELPQATKFLLVVDQFEELFRYSDRRIGQVRDLLREARARNEAESFVALLLEARRNAKREIHILITMRSDFIGDCERFPGLPEAVSATQFLVPGMTRDQYEAVIRKPIGRARATIEPELVQQLLNDSDDDERDKLPVLQHCLLQLWEQAGAGSAQPPDAHETAGPENSRPIVVGRHIDMEHYRQIGGIAHALSQHADRILMDYPEQSVEVVFRALSELKDGRAIRRHLPYQVLREECGIPEDELASIVNRFRADDCSFLVTVPPGVTTLRGDTIIDVGHEALLRRWERSSGVPGASGESGDNRPIGWLRQERKDGQKYQNLLSMVDSDNVSRKVEDIERHWKWWHERQRTKRWAERYGGKHDDVEKLLREGWAHRRNVQIRDWALGTAGAIIVLSALYFGYSQSEETKIKSRIADANADLVISNTQTFLGEVLDALNSGGMHVDAAMKIERSLHSVITKLNKVGDPLKAKEVEIQFDTMAVDFLTDAGQRTAALNRAQEAKDLAQKLSDLDVTDDTRRGLLRNTQLRLGDAFEDSGNRPKSLEQYRAALAIAQQLADKQPGDGERQFALAFSHNKVGDTLSFEKDYAAAREQYGAALGIATRLAEKSTENAGWQAYVPSMMTKIADAQVKSGMDVGPALAQFDAAIARQNDLAKKFPGNAVIISNLASSHREKGEALAASGRWSGASDEFTAAAAGRERLLEIDPNNASWLDYRATDYARSAEALVKQADQAVYVTAGTDAVAVSKESLLQAALAQTQQELKDRQELNKRDPNLPRWQEKLAQTQAHLADIENRISKLNKAE